MAPTAQETILPVRDPREDEILQLKSRMASNEERGQNHSASGKAATTNQQTEKRPELPGGSIATYISKTPHNNVETF
eukprot:658108-Amphidinium_carterae.1